MMKVVVVMAVEDVYNGKVEPVLVSLSDLYLDDDRILGR